MPPPLPPPPPLVLGVLGGIASGKSAAAEALAGPGGLVVSADALAHEVLASAEVAALVAEAFGAGCLDAQGRPDRGRLAERVFGDEVGRRLLEGWIHPRVRARILEELERAVREGVPRVALDVPLLLETDARLRESLGASEAERLGLARRCHALVFVDADEGERDRRAVTSRGWDPGEVARREAAQLPLAEKRSRAHHVIHNDGDLAHLQAEARRVLAAVEASRS